MNASAFIQRSSQKKLFLSELNVCFLFFFLAFTPLANAKEPYHASIRVQQCKASTSAPNLVDLTNQLKAAALNQLLPIYTPVSATLLQFNLRGIFADAAFAENSPTLTVYYPQINKKELFQGATRDESLKLFKDSIRDGGEGKALLKAYPIYSPIDPIAGNPLSLQASMLRADYLLAELSACSSRCRENVECSGNIKPFMGGAGFARGFSKGFDATIAKLPLRYVCQFKQNSSFIFDLPLAYQNNGGASSMQGSFGLGFQRPLTDRWSVTAVSRAGCGGSLDLCTGGTLVSFSLVSEYAFSISKYELAMINCIGYSTSINFWLTGINFSYNLHNIVSRNGIRLSSCEEFSLLGCPFNFSLGFADNYFAKDRLYIKHFDELSCSFTVDDLRVGDLKGCLSVCFSYQFGQRSYQGYLFDLNYFF